MFADSCVELIRAQSRLLRTRRPLDVEESLTASDLTIMLKLLEKLVDEGMTSKTTFVTMSDILAAMSESLLTYPGLPEAYFQFVSMAVWRYASQLSSLPDAVKAQLISSLKLAINSYNTAVQNKGLEALSIFAEHSKTDVSGLLDASMREFLLLLLEGILSDAFQLYSASVALLAILFYNEGRGWLEDAGKELLEKRASLGPVLHKIVVAANQAKSNGAFEPTLNTVNRKRKRDARSGFVDSVRKIVLETVAAR